MVALTIDTVPISGAIRCDDPLPLRNIVRRFAGNRLLPRASGRRRLSMLLDQVDETLTFKVNGLVDNTGAPNADPVTGVEANLEFYRALFLPDIAHALTLDYAGTSFAGEVQIPESSQVRTGPLSALIVARFVIPAGELV